MLTGGVELAWERALERGEEAVAPLRTRYLKRMGNISDSGPRQKGIDQPGAADAYNTDELPGPLAAGACGLTGLLCVVIAGWSTANPTIYRAGLAFQAIVPKVSHSFLTLPI